MRISQTQFNSGEYLKPVFLRTNKDGSSVYSALHTCRRCNGTGHYSYNQVYGTTCMECWGSKISRYDFTVVDDKKFEVAERKKRESVNKRINDMIESFYKQFDRQIEFARNNPWARKRIIACYNPEKPDWSCVDYTKCAYNLVVGESFYPVPGGEPVVLPALTKSEKYLNKFKILLDIV